MNKLIFIIIFVLIQSTTVYALSPLHVDGRWIKNETDSIITLRGVNHPGFVDDPTGLWRCQGCNLWGGVHTWDPNAVKANLDNMSQTWGMNVLRLHNSIEWWKTDNSSYRQHIKDVITWAGERGMYVIYDTYCVKYYPLCVQEYLPIPPYLNSTLGEDQVITSEQDFIDQWESIAQELKNYPNVIFEIYNEPHGNDTAKEKYFNISQRIINAIRLTGAQQIIIIQWDYGIWANLDYSPGSTMSWIENYPLTDSLNNLVYSTHLYRGNFHRTIGGRVDSWAYDEIKLGLQNCLVDYVINTSNKPLIVGEIGANMWWTGEGLERELAFFNNSLSIFNEWNLSYMDWVWTTPSHMQHGVLQNTIWIPPPNDAGQILINKIAEGEPNIQKVKLSGKLKDKNNLPVNAKIILSKQGAIKIKYTSQTDNGNYELSVLPGTYDIQFNLTNFFISGYSIKINSVNISKDTDNLVQSVTGDQTGNKVSIVLDLNKTQEIDIYNSDMPLNIKRNCTILRNVSSLLELNNNTWFYDSTNKKLYIMAAATPSNNLTDGLPTADYYVVESESIYYAINGSSKQIFLTSCNAPTLINAVFNALKSGQKIYFNGNFTINSTISVDVANVLMNFSQVTLNLTTSTTLLVIRGSNVTVLGGHWIGTNNPSSTTDVGITVFGTNDTIDGAEMQGFGYNQLGATAILPGWGSGYLTIKNCILHNNAQHINFEQNGIGHNKVQNCTFYNSEHSPIFVSSGTPYNEVTNCEFYNWVQHGMYINGGDGGLGGNIVSECNFHDSDGDALSIKGKNNTFYNNQFTNLSVGFSIHSQYHDAEANDNEIYNNSFTNITFGISLGTDDTSTGGPQPTSRNKIHDNSFTNVVNSFLIGGFNNNPKNTVDNTKIYYNTFNSCTNIFPTAYNSGQPAMKINTTIAYNDFGMNVSESEETTIKSWINTMIYNNTGMEDFNVPSPPLIPPP